MEMSSQSIKSYVISLETAQQRREHITREFSDKGITFEFFDALFPSPRLDEEINKLLPNLSLQNNLTVGEKACFMSHISLWKKCLDNNLDYIAIFEDDVFMGKNSDAFLSNDLWLKERFSVNDSYIIHLETFVFPSKYKRSNIKSYYGRKFHIMSSMHFGAAGYIISRTAIEYLFKLFLSYTPSQLEPIDMLIFDRLLNDKNLAVYQLSPAICIQENRLYQTGLKFKSQLEDDRAKLLQAIKKDKKARNIFSKIGRELFRLKRRITHRKIKFI